MMMIEEDKDNEFIFDSELENNDGDLSDDIEESDDDDDDNEEEEEGEIKTDKDKYLRKIKLTMNKLIKEDENKFDKMLKAVKRLYPNKTLMKSTEKDFDSIQFIDESTRDIGWKTIATCLLEEEYLEPDELIELPK